MARGAALGRIEWRARDADQPAHELAEQPLQVPGARPDAPLATLRFLSGWVTAQTGELRRGGRLSVEYDPQRLPNRRAQYNGMPTWGIYLSARFHPGGQSTSGHLLQFFEGDPPRLLEPPRPVAYELTVPDDATRIELWFHNSDRTGRTDWDSRFGQNYWFDVGPSRAQPAVSYRTGARTDPAIVNVFGDAATKTNKFPAGEFGRNGVDYETRLFVQAWARNLSPIKSVWIDFHVFDGAGDLVHAETQPLVWLAGANGEGDFFVIDAFAYQGSVATPGSVSPRPDARTVQYRLYCEVDGQVYTDGLLHQHGLPKDALTR